MTNVRSNKKIESARRKLLKTVMAGGGAITASKLMPEQWTRPVVASVMLPAHAGLSTCNFRVDPPFAIDGAFDILGGSLTATSPPFSGTISGGNFSMSATSTNISCNLGDASVLFSVSGSAGGNFSGFQNVYCDGTLVGSCSATGEAAYSVTRLVIDGSLFCTYCPDVLFAG